MISYTVHVTQMHSYSLPDINFNVCLIVIGFRRKGNLYPTPAHDISMSSKKIRHALNSSLEPKNSNLEAKEVGIIST
jgi:hypothetical protein